MSLRSDAHAHLDYMADRCGPEAMLRLRETYKAASGGAEAPYQSGGALVGSEGAAAPYILDIGTEPGDLSGRLERYGDWGFVRFSAGLWPGRETFDDIPRALSLLEADIALPQCVALGECGLDYHHMLAPPATQRKVFSLQIEMAVRAGLPLVVHTRDAFADTRAVLADAAVSIPVIIHCFGYGPAEAQAFLEAGCYLSFAGNITYKNAAALREACMLVPADKLLVETDAPYMNPEPLRGRPATSLDIDRSLQYIASLRHDDVESLAAQVHRTGAALFQK